MKLRLYRIETEVFPAMHVAARSSHQAADIYVTWEAAVGRASESFSVELVPIGSLDPDQQNQLRSLLTVSTEGIAFFESGRGWNIDSEGWTSFSDEEIDDANRGPIGG
jgi:hypothetical protein